MNSINLLPKKIKGEYRSSKKNRVMLSAFISTLVLSTILIGILFASQSYLNKKYTSAEKELIEKEKSIEKYGNLEQDATKLETRLKNAKEIIDKKVYFTKALAQIGSSVPPQMYILEIEAEKDTAERGKILGSAENKNQIAAFIEVLEDTGSFEYVDLDVTERTVDPFLGVVKENFTISFSINKKDIDEKS